MRVISTAPAPALASVPTQAARRAANIELLGLLACSVVLVLGLGVTYAGRIGQLEAASRSAQPLNLDRLRGPADLLPVLRMFEHAPEREAVAHALYRAITADAPPLEHVGGLARVSLPAAEIAGAPDFPYLYARLQRRPGAAELPLLTAADIAAIKPRVIVRTRAEFTMRVLTAAAWFFGAFWTAHLVRRRRGAGDDPLILPILLLLSGIGMMAMLALRDPLRDTIAVTPFATGVAAGLVLLLFASEVDYEASVLRRAMLAPLTLALALATLLLVFGTGPGASGVKVNLLGVQPVEAIRLLVVLALAAYFARRLEFLREYSEAATADRPWLRYVRLPRWIDVRPVVVSMTLVLAFFFLQKDLGPALVLSCVFLGLYGIARGRLPFVLVGVLLLLAAFAFAYWIGYPATVRQRVAIWTDPWNNAVPGGNQVAHGQWALSSGALAGSGAGLGSPQTIPAGHTDFVLAAVGEELGFVGFAAIIGLYAMLGWRCLRTALRAPGDFSALLAVGIMLALVLQALVIAGGLLGLIPLAGVVTPFLSYGRSSMLANCLGLGIVLAIARRSGPVRAHLQRPMRGLAGALAAAAIVLAAQAAWIQVLRADRVATQSSLTEQADGGTRFEYNPRLVTASRSIPRGTILDRNGLAMATSDQREIAGLADAYRAAGIAPHACTDTDARCYPLGGAAFSLVGDWNRQTNWGARNSSYFERDSDTVLRGYDDHQRLVEVVSPRTGVAEQTIRRDYRELLPLVRHRHDPGHPAVRALLDRPRELRTSIDARLQARTAAALRSAIEKGGFARGAAVVLDVGTGEVLASVSHPWPSTTAGEPPPSTDGGDPTFDRARYGLYPPGSTFKLLVAAAALRDRRSPEPATFACVRLPDGRVGQHVPGWRRPVRDDLLDATPHGRIGLRRALVVSCNAYFAQLALRLGPRAILDAASLFQIESARPPTPVSLGRMLPHAGYGQAEVLASPLKMARVAAAIATGGVVRPVRWLAGERRSSPAQPERFLAAADAAELSRYLREAVTTGTGRTLASNPTPIAGKTGTAEVAGDRSHAWFAGFAPYGGARPIAFAVIVENAGYGGRAAAPVAGEIVTAARELGLLK